MVREIAENELNELLKLYLYLHEDSVPEMTEHLKNTIHGILLFKMKIITLSLMRSTIK